MTTPRFPFPPDPTGWYHLAESSDVAVGASCRIEALGASLDVSRDAAGTPHVAHPTRGPLPADDVNGSLLGFWDAQGRAPQWRIPIVEACASPAWERVADRHWRLRSHPQEIGENIVDTAHILVLHGADRMPVRVAFFARRRADVAATRAIGDAFVARFCAEFDADLPILEHKKHLPAPLLCDADGPITTWRRWCRQFYA